MRGEARAVGRYYDANAVPFALFGRSSAPLPVHRRIALPGARSRRAALGTVHRRVAEAAREHGSRGLLDLGCGHGALLFDLQARLPGLALAGLTLSARQARIAASWTRARAAAPAPAGGAPPPDVRVASYLVPSAYPPLPSPRLLVAIESFVHSPGPAAFMAATAAYAARADRLVVCDDFMAEGGVRGALAGRVERAFRRGWRAPGACTAGELTAAAEACGWRVIAGEDWTPFVPRAGRVFGWACAALLRCPRLFSRRPLLGSLVGGAALVVGYRLGIFCYRYLEFERT